MPIPPMKVSCDAQLTVEQLAELFTELDNVEMLQFFEHAVAHVKNTWGNGSSHKLDYIACWVVNDTNISQDCLNFLSCLQRRDTTNDALYTCRKD